MNCFKYTLDNKRYHTFNYYLKSTYGQKVAKVIIDGHFTCPNRDGLKGTGGCTFCSALGSGDSNLSMKNDYLSQYINNKKVMDRKWNNGLYIPYFQSFSNTYGPLSKIKEMLEPFIHLDEVAEISIATRCDCLSDEIIANRAAILATVAQNSYKERLKTVPDAIEPIYIIGSEVPIPGGSLQNNNDMQITKADDLDHTIKAFEKAFIDHGVKDAYDNVIGIVVQPGVEEKDDGCVEYDRNKAKELMAAIDKYDNLIYEGHSTDYQTKIKLKELVEDKVKILKVGPALTFAMREGLFSLAYIEKELYKNTNKQTSDLIEKLEKRMLSDDKYWHKHYFGSIDEIAFKCKYSFSDRIRYYMVDKQIQDAINILFDNLKDGIPLNLLSQFMPIQYTKVREKTLANTPNALVKDRIKNCIDEYLYATQQHLIK